MKLRITYDQSVRAAYIYLDRAIAAGAAVVQCPVECPELKSEVIVDIDKHGRLLGIEILGVDRKPEVSRVTFDRSADAVYIHLGDIAPGELVESCGADCPELKGDVNLGIDRNGDLRGVEILGARRILPSRLIEEAEPL